MSEVVSETESVAVAVPESEPTVELLESDDESVFPVAVSESRDVSASHLPFVHISPKVQSLFVLHSDSLSLHDEQDVRLKTPKQRINAAGMLSLITLDLAIYGSPFRKYWLPSPATDK